VREIYFSFYHVIIFICTFQGFLLAYIFLFNKKFRKKSSIALSIGLVALSIAGLWEIIQDLELNKQYTLLGYLPISNLSLGAISLYYFVAFLLNRTYKFSKKDYLFIAPFVFIFLVKLIFYSIDLAHPSFLAKHQYIDNFFNILTNYLPIFYMVWVIQSLLKKINHYHEQLFNNFSETEGKDLYWLKNLLYFLIVFTISWFLVTSIHNYPKKG